MSSEVTVGHDGWLFLTGGANEVIRYYNDPTYFGAREINAWADLIAQRAAMAASRSILYAHMAPPEKLTIYPEFFPSILTHPDQTPARSVPKAFSEDSRRSILTPAFIDTLPALELAKAEGQQLYWKTDTHWTFEGAYAAYLALCERVGAAPDRTIPARNFNYGPLVLDLGAKLSPPPIEIYRTQHIQFHAVRNYANELVLYKEENQLEGEPGLHGGSHVIFQNRSPTADPRRLVLFGDSYAEYRPVLLTAILAETFAEVHFIWSASIDWGYVDEIRPDILVTELAERFMTYVPADDLDIQALARDRVERHRATTPC